MIKYALKSLVICPTGREAKNYIHPNDARGLSGIYFDLHELGETRWAEEVIDIETIEKYRDDDGCGVSIKDMISSCQCVIVYSPAQDFVKKLLSKKYLDEYHPAIKGLVNRVENGEQFFANHTPAIFVQEVSKRFDALAKIEGYMKMNIFTQAG